MRDVVVVVIILGFFLLAAQLIRACDRIVSDRSEETEQDTGLTGSRPR